MRYGSVLQVFLVNMMCCSSVKHEEPGGLDYVSIGKPVSYYSYTGKNRLEEHFICLRVAQKYLAATNENVKFYCPLRPKFKQYFIQYTVWY